MDEYSNAMPPQYYSQPMAPWHPMSSYSGDAAYTPEDHSRSGDLASFPPTQLHPSYTIGVYPSLPIGAERAPEDHPFPQDPSFPPTNDFPARDLPNIQRIYSDPQYEVEGVESDTEDMESNSESEPVDHPLPADAARWISMSPTHFDKEYPGRNPFVIQELNLDSEEDTDSASYVELEGARVLNRMFVVFWAVECAIFPYAFTDIHREIVWGVLADLLRDGKIWLWVEGDEEKCADLHPGYSDKYLRRSLGYVEQRLSCSSLRLRKPCLPAWTQFLARLSKASFEMRISVIVWAIITSLSVREARWARGYADWTRCVLHDAVRKWHHVVEDLDHLGNEDQNSHLEVAFKHTLRSHGHSCYSSPPEYLKKSLKRWLYLQSFLHSTFSGKDVSLILFVESHQESSCQQCAKLKEFYIANNDAPHIPPLSLLVLNDLRLTLDIDTAAWLSVLEFGVSCGIISAAIIIKLNDEIRTHLDIGRFYFKYQPWVNRLPSSLRCSVVTCSESEWREAEHAVRTENQYKSVTTSRWDSPDIGLGVRVTAIYLLMSEHSSQKLTPLKYRTAFYDDCPWNDVLDGRLRYPTDVAASIEAFCEASTHTCCEFGWHKLERRQCYAAAYLLLHPDSHDVPLLDPLRRSVTCEVCAFRWYECQNCEQCRKLPKAGPLVPTQITVPEATVPPTDGTDDIVKVLPTTSLFVAQSTQISTLPVVGRNSRPVSVTVSQIPSTSSPSRASALPKDVILPELKTHFAKLLAQHDIPIQYTNLGTPQLPWCTLPQLLRDRRLEIAGWPEHLPLPDATGKHNAKGIMGLTAKDARCLYEALPSISFRPMSKGRTRPRQEESEDDSIGNPPTKKAKGKGKASEQGEKKFRVSDVQTVIGDIHVRKSN